MVFKLIKAIFLFSSIVSWELCLMVFEIFNWRIINVNEHEMPIITALVVTIEGIFISFHLLPRL